MEGKGINATRVPSPARVKLRQNRLCPVMTTCPMRRCKGAGLEPASVVFWAKSLKDGHFCTWEGIWWPNKCSDLRDTAQFCRQAAGSPRQAPEAEQAASEAPLEAGAGHKKRIQLALAFQFL